MNFAYQLVQEIGRRTREEHKTVLTFGRQDTLALQSERRIANPNPLRRQMLRSYKIYNKERATLERHDARLAVSVCLSRPPRALIEGLAVELDRIDPYNRVHTNCTPSAPAVAKSLTREVVISFPDAIPVFFYVGETGYISAEPDEAGLVYSHHDKPKLESWKIKRADGSTAWSVTSQFADHGGWLGSNLQGPPGGTPAQRTIEVRAWRAQTPFASALTPGSWWTKEVTASVRVHFIPVPTADPAYAACLDAERVRRRSLVTADMLDAILRRAFAPMREHLLRRAILDAFGEAFTFAGPDADRFILQSFRHCLDWNEAIIQTTPGWMGGQEEQAFEDIRLRLSEMLRGYDPRRVVPPDVVAGGAQVILPIRPGADQAVLDLLTGHQIDTSDFVKSFVRFRDEQFGAAARTLPSAAEVLSPADERPTATGAAVWDNGWEMPPRRFRVLNAWSEHVPTNGVRVEATLGSGHAVDEIRLATLAADIADRATPPGPGD